MASLSDSPPPDRKLAPAKSINMLSSELAGSDSDGDDLLDELPAAASSATASTGGGGLEFAEMRHEMNSTKDESMMLADNLEEPTPAKAPKESGGGGGCCLVS